MGHHAELTIVREVDFGPQFLCSRGASEVHSCNCTPGGCFSTNVNDEPRRIHLQLFHELKIIHCKIPEVDVTGLDLKPENTKIRPFQLNLDFHIQLGKCNYPCPHYNEPFTMWNFVLT